MSLNNLFVKSKFENHIEMENVESPSKSSPMNLSTRPIERNVLKELNNLEGATKSSKQASAATDDQEIQLKDSTNLSNNLPDIVTNVHSDGGKVVNKNLLYVVTPPDVLSDDEYVDCDTTFQDNEPEVSVNKEIDRVSKILDETIQILEKEKLNEGFIDAANSSNKSVTPNVPVNNLIGWKSENITEDSSKEIISSLTDSTEIAGLPETIFEATSQRVVEPLLCEQQTKSKEASDELTVISDELNESSKFASAVDRTIVKEEVEQDTNLTGGDKSATLDVIDTAASVIETAVPVIKLEIPEVESVETVNYSLEVVTESTPPVLNSDASGKFTKSDVELNTLNQTHVPNILVKTDDSSTCLQETSFTLTNTDINQTCTIESNPENVDKFVTVEVTEPEELSITTTEPKQLEKIREFKSNQTISVDSLDIDGETRECSLDSLEMKQPIHHEPVTSTDTSATTGDDIFSKKQSPDLSEMFSNASQTSNDLADLIESTNQRSSFDKTNSNESLMRRDTSISVDSNNKSQVLLETMPNIGTVTNELVEQLCDFLPQGTNSVPSPIEYNQGAWESNKQISQSSNGKPSIESSINEKIDSTNRLKRRGTFNVPTPTVLEDLPDEDSDDAVFQLKSPSLSISSSVEPKKEQFADNNNSNCMVLNSNDFDFLQSRGGYRDPEDERRNSLLLRFDPLSRRSLHTTKFAPSGGIAEETDLNGSEGIAAGSSSNNTSASHSLSTNETPSNGILVQISPSMDNEANGYLNNTRTERSDEKLISVDGVSLTDKKIKLACNDSDIQKKMEEYEATQEILLKRITEKDKAITKTSNVLELYEKAIAEALAAKEKLSQSYDKQHEELKTDRDVNFQHLLSLESTFADLHMKFERNVQYTSQLQEKLNAVAEDKAKSEDLLKQQELRYDKMKSHTMQQFDIANNKLEQQTKASSSENTKLKAQIKREVIHKTAVQDELSQKKKQNEELVKICDELISGQRS